MRIPRRAAVVVSAVALTGALAACGDNAEDGTGGTGGGGVDQPLTPGGGTDGGLDDGIQEDQPAG